jgi:hypothetical protein
VVSQSEEQTENLQSAEHDHLQEIASGAHVTVNNPFMTAARAFAIAAAHEGSPHAPCGCNSPMVSVYDMSDKGPFDKACTVRLLEFFTSLSQAVKTREKNRLQAPLQAAQGDYCTDI